MVDPEFNASEPTGPGGPLDPDAEHRVRQALSDAVANVEADDRLHALVADRRADIRTPRSRRPWLVAAALVVVVGVVGAVIAVDRGNDTTKDIDRVATEPPTQTSTTVASSTTLPIPSEAWGTMSEAPIGPRSLNNTASVWTGSELIVWGEAGSTAPGADNRSGAAYDPTTDSWRTIAPSPVEAINSMAVWTGTEMVIGPARPEAAPAESFEELVYAAYDPAADTWRSLPGTVDGMGGRPTLWTGTEVVLDATQYGDPALTALDLVTGDRRAVPAPPPPIGDLNDRPVGGTTYVAMNDGQIAAISSYQSSVNNLAISNRGLTAWTEVPVTGIDPTSLSVVSVWTGKELVSAFPGGAAYDPAAGTWRQIALRPDQSGPDPGSTETTASADEPPPPAPASPWMGMPTVFTGRYLISEAGVYEPNADRWLDLDVDVPEHRSDPLVAWDGTKVLIWGGMLPCEYVGGRCTTPESELFPSDGLTFQP